MFYQTRVSIEEVADPVSALVSLTPSEAKRVIARGVATLPEVKRAMQRGLIVIGRGTTNAYVAEELTGEKIANKSHYAAGFIVDGELSATPVTSLIPVFVLRDGKRADIAPPDALREFGEKDVSIKGASAVDADGNVGVCAASPESGTIGGILPTVLARRSYLIAPVGLEKLVPSVPQACEASGVFHFKYSTGLPIALVPMPNALAVTEVQAFEVLTGVRAVAIAAGGVGGSEGTTVLSMTGGAAQIEKAMALVRAIKGEPPTGRPAARVTAAAASFEYDAMEQWRVQAVDAKWHIPAGFGR